MELMTPTYSYI